MFDEQDDYDILCTAMDLVVCIYICICICLYLYAVFLCCYRFFRRIKIYIKPLSGFKFRAFRAFVFSYSLRVMGVLISPLIICVMLSDIKLQYLTSPGYRTFLRVNLDGNSVAVRRWPREQRLSPVSLGDGGRKPMQHMLGVV